MTVCTVRLHKEYRIIVKEPVPNVEAHPHPENLREWHYVLFGPAGSPYAGGIYHGCLQFPPEYPMKPPSIMMYTPNGRFAVKTRLCLSMSDFHPETWNPLWSVSSILTGLLSFMLEDTQTYGSISTTTAEKKKFALASHAFNSRGKVFCTLFPHLVRRSPSPQPQPPATAAAAATADPPQDDQTDPRRRWLLIVAVLALAVAFSLFVSYEYL
eukprot:TRINITY_DN1807_c0_g1_i4.p1 TRINITY_DN1807_c0_g1~~TRINITY_DN1807_c0_g1_i4.p1  ORF type:complete len:223 (+),score=63.09 TRINITY_DN1807_c0_g1_i4:36-671(+)